MTIRRFEKWIPMLLAGSLAGCGEPGPAGPPGNQQSLTDPSIPPRVISTYPADGRTGPFNLYAHGASRRPHFVVELNKVIERSAFRSGWFRMEGFDPPLHFELLPDIFDPSAGDLLTRVLPVRVIEGSGKGYADFEIGRTYTVTVDTTLEDFTGRHPLQPHRFSFTPEPWFRVLRVTPNTSDLSVQPSSEVTLQFNSQVDSTIVSSVQLLPAVSGVWRIRDPWSVTFLHPQELPFGARYTVTVRSTAADTHGNPLRSRFESQFVTVQFRIVATYPGDAQAGIRERDGIRVTASGRLDPTSVQRAFHIEPPVGGEFLVSESDFGLYKVLFDLETRYTVTISTALHAWDGTPLPAPYVFSFTTDRFRVLHTWPRDGESFAYRRQGIDVQCTGGIDSTSVAPSFSIVPPVGGRFRTSDGIFEFVPNAELPALTIYTCTISTALRSSRQLPLREPYRFAFRTGPR